MFCGASALCITTYGGLLGILPAYISDTFGIKNTPSIFGRCMTGWATAALIGPKLLTYMRETSVNEAIHDLTTKVEPSAFTSQFGVGPEQVQSLIDTKAITIRALMDIAPTGTIDPTCTSQRMQESHPRLFPHERGNGGIRHHPHELESILLCSHYV